MLMLSCLSSLADWRRCTESNHWNKSARKINLQPVKGKYMPYRNKVFISFDGDNDMHYYRLMRAWKQNDNSSFNFFDAHDINTALDSSMEVTIKRRLSERLDNSKAFVSLIGERTRYLYKFVRWELEQAIERDLPIIGINLNGLRMRDNDLCPPVIRDALVIYVGYRPAIVQYALENWPSQYVNLRKQKKSGPYYYNEKIYRSLGL